MNTLPISVQHSIANHYYIDARDFAYRFDTLWEDQLHKTGRIKSFLDLFMGCECILKSHVFLGRLNSDPDSTYKEVIAAGHNVDKLSKLANFLKDKAAYEMIGSKLAPFSVFIRYSLDAWPVFFPALTEWNEAPINYRDTIGSNSWVLDVRKSLDTLIESSVCEFSGLVSNDIDAIIEHGTEMEMFVRRVSRKSRQSRCGSKSKSRS